MRELTPTMLEALALVPAEWGKMPWSCRVGERRLSYPRLQPTFRALKARGLVEWRCPEGGRWEWRRAPAPTAEGAEKETTHG